MSNAFAMWLREPHSNLRGTIQQPDDAKRKAYIRPDAFPAERLFFRYDHWPVTLRHRSLQNRPVIFDLKPYPDWSPETNPEAINVRLVPVAATSPAPRPVYTTSS